MPDGVLDEVADAAIGSTAIPSGAHSDVSHESKIDFHLIDIDKQHMESTWLTDRYAALEVGQRARPCNSQWQRLLVRRDELLAVQESGQVLHGFKEGPIGFPPTYRRVRGIEGDCWDYTDVHRLQKCYTTYVGESPTNSILVDDDEEEQNQRSFKPTNMRVPSYTDRIW